MLTRHERRSRSFLAFVTGTFVFGWAIGFAAVSKLWLITNTPRSMLTGGFECATFMLLPPIIGFLVARLFGGLMARGWAGVSLGLVAVGAVGLVAGLLVL